MEIFFKLFGKIFFETVSETTPVWFLLALIGVVLLGFAVYGIWNADKYANVGSNKNSNGDTP
jgi:hypothetical protein